MNTMQQLTDFFARSPHRIPSLAQKLLLERCQQNQPNASSALPSALDSFILDTAETLYHHYPPSWLHNWKKPSNAASPPLFPWQHPSRIACSHPLRSLSTLDRPSWLQLYEQEYALPVPQVWGYGQWLRIGGMGVLALAILSLFFGFMLSVLISVASVLGYYGWQHLIAKKGQNHLDRVLFLHSSGIMIDSLETIRLCAELDKQHYHSADQGADLAKDAPDFAPSLRPLIDQLISLNKSLSETKLSDDLRVFAEEIIAHNKKHIMEKMIPFMDERLAVVEARFSLPVEALPTWSAALKSLEAFCTEIEGLFPGEKALEKRIQRFKEINSPYAWIASDFFNHSFFTPQGPEPLLPRNLFPQERCKTGFDSPAKIQREKLAILFPDHPDMPAIEQALLECEHVFSGQCFWTAEQLAQRARILFPHNLVGQAALQEWSFLSYQGQGPEWDCFPVTRQEALRAALRDNPSFQKALAAYDRLFDSSAHATSEKKKDFLKVLVLASQISGADLALLILLGKMPPLLPSAAAAPQRPTILNIVHEYLPFYTGESYTDLLMEALDAGILSVEEKEALNNTDPSLLFALFEANFYPLIGLEAAFLNEDRDAPPTAEGAEQGSVIIPSDPPIFAFIKPLLEKRFLHELAKIYHILNAPDFDRQSFAPDQYLLSFTRAETEWLKKTTSPQHPDDDARAFLHSPLYTHYDWHDLFSQCLATFCENGLISAHLWKLYIGKGLSFFLTRHLRGEPMPVLQAPMIPPILIQYASVAGLPPIWLPQLEHMLSSHFPLAQLFTNTPALIEGSPRLEIQDAPSAQENGETLRALLNVNQSLEGALLPRVVLASRQETAINEAWMALIQVQNDPYNEEKITRARKLCYPFLAEMLEKLSAKIAPTPSTPTLAIDAAQGATVPEESVEHPTAALTLHSPEEENASALSFLRQEPLNILDTVYKIFPNLWIWRLFLDSVKSCPPIVSLYGKKSIPVCTKRPEVKSVWEMMRVMHEKSDYPTAANDPIEKSPLLVPICGIALILKAQCPEEWSEEIEELFKTWLLQGQHSQTQIESDQQEEEQDIESFLLSSLSRILKKTAPHQELIALGCLNPISAYLLSILMSPYEERSLYWAAFTCAYPHDRWFVDYWTQSWRQAMRRHGRSDSLADAAIPFPFVAPTCLEEIKEKLCRLHARCVETELAPTDFSGRIPVSFLFLCVKILSHYQDPEQDNKTILQAFTSTHYKPVDDLSIEVRVKNMPIRLIPTHPDSTTWLIEQKQKQLFRFIQEHLPSNAKASSLENMYAAVYSLILLFEDMARIPLPLSCLQGSKHSPRDPIVIMNDSLLRTDNSGSVKTTSPFPGDCVDLPYDPTTPSERSDRVPPSYRVYAGMAFIFSLLKGSSSIYEVHLPHNADNADGHGFHTKKLDSLSLLNLFATSTDTQPQIREYCIRGILNPEDHYALLRIVIGNDLIVKTIAPTVSARSSVHTPEGTSREYRPSAAQAPTAHIPPVLPTENSLHPTP